MIIILSYMENSTSDESLKIKTKPANAGQVYNRKQATTKGAIMDYYIFRGEFGVSVANLKQIKEIGIKKYKFLGSFKTRREAEDYLYLHGWFGDRALMPLINKLERNWK